MYTEKKGIWSIENKIQEKNNALKHNLETDHSHCRHGPL